MTLGVLGTRGSSTAMLVTILLVPLVLVAVLIVGISVDFGGWAYLG